MMDGNIFTRFCGAYCTTLNTFGDIDTDDFFSNNFSRIERRNQTDLYRIDGYKKNIFGKETEITTKINIIDWFDAHLKYGSFETRESMTKILQQIYSGLGYDRFEYPSVIIKKLGEFIVNTSKYYFVDVDFLNNFTILNHDQYSISILIEKEDVKVKYEFIESAINLPGKNGFNLSKDNPLAFINDESTENKTVEFINITVMDKDDSVVDEFKYVYGQRLEGESVERTNLFYYTIELSKIVIFDTFMDILNKYVFRRTKFWMRTGRRMLVRDFLNDGSYSFWR